MFRWNKFFFESSGLVTRSFFQTCHHSHPWFHQVTKFSNSKDCSSCLHIIGEHALKSFEFRVKSCCVSGNHTHTPRYSPISPVTLSCFSSTEGWAFKGAVGCLGRLKRTPLAPYEKTCPSFEPGTQTVSSCWRNPKQLPFGCLKPVNNGINYQTSTGAGFLPSTRFPAFTNRGEHRVDRSFYVKPLIAP